MVILACRLLCACWIAICREDRVLFRSGHTLRGRSVFETHASEASISPGINLGSGTVQKPLDLSKSILRQC